MSEEEISTILNTYMYFDYKEADDGMSMEEIVKELSSSPDCAPGGVHYGEYMVLSDAVKNQQVGSLIIDNQSHLMGFDSGTAGCTFYTPDRNCIYVVYRGTGDGEWPDNGIGMTKSSTVQQQRALSYFETTIDKMNITEKQRLILTGHSKGGNKAQYALMSSDYGELVDVCYNIDGQGFSEDAINTWIDTYGESEYEKRRNRIIGVYGENDYVNVLGHSIVPQDNIYYIQTPVEKSNFAGYHDIKYMFAQQVTDPVTGEVETIFTGMRNAYALQRGDLGNYAAQLSEDVMKLPEYRRDGCAAVIMQLMEVTRGSKEGINGEKLSLPDIDDFGVKGPELIGNSLFFSVSGINLLYSMFLKPSLICDMKGDVRFGIQEEKLRLWADNLEKLALLIKKEKSELGSAEERLSHALYGNFDIRNKLVAGERELKKLQLLIERASGQLMEIIGLYQESDEVVSNSCEI